MPPILSKVLNSAESKAFLSKAKINNAKVMVIVAPASGGKSIIGGDMSVEEAMAHLSAHPPGQVVHQPLQLPPLPMPYDVLCEAKHQDARRSYVKLLKAVFLPERTGSLGNK